MDTLLVIGAESTVGANVACTLADAFQVVGLSRAGEVELERRGAGVCVHRNTQ